MIPTQLHLTPRFTSKIQKIQQNCLNRSEAWQAYEQSFFCSLYKHPFFMTSPNPFTTPFIFHFFFFCFKDLSTSSEVLRFCFVFTSYNDCCRCCGLQECRTSHVHEGLQQACSYMRTSMCFFTSLETYPHIPKISSFKIVNLQNLLSNTKNEGCGYR